MKCSNPAPHSVSDHFFLLCLLQLWAGSDPGSAGQLSQSLSSVNREMQSLARGFKLTFVKLQGDDRQMSRVTSRKQSLTRKSGTYKSEKSRVPARAGMGRALPAHFL